MSDAIHARLDGEFRTRRVGKFRVKGRQEVTVVHELLGPARQDQEPEWIAKYHQALAALDENNIPAALEFFTAASACRGPLGDGPSRLFIDRIHSGEPIQSGILDIREK